MRALPKGINQAELPDLAHYRGHGIDRINAWCLTPLCHHRAALTFERLQAQRGEGQHQAVGCGPASPVHRMRPAERGRAAGLVANVESTRAGVNVGNDAAHLAARPVTACRRAATAIP